MNNLIITSGYKKDTRHGNYIQTKNICVIAHNSIQDRDNYELEDLNVNIEIPNIPDDCRYLYLLESYVSAKEYGCFVNESNINISYHFSEKEAIESGKRTMINGLVRDYLDLEIYNEDEKEELYDDILNMDDYHLIKYEFNIYKILVNRHIFEYYTDAKKYYQEQLSLIKSKNDLYDLLLDIAGGYQITKYDFKGNILNINVPLIFRSIYNFSIPSLLGWHVEKFNIGDVVKLKDPYYKDETFKIIYKITHDHDIYKDPDPLHFREGYTLVYANTGNIFNEYWEDYIYDEQLELVKI